MSNAAQTTTAERALLDAVDNERDALVAFYRDLVRIPSIWRHADALGRAADLIAGRLREAGFNTELPDSGTDRMPMVLGRLSGTGGGRSMLLNGHMEVYPPSDSWTVDPFGGVIKDGRIFGQGSADMKGGTAAMTMAAWLVGRHAERLAGDLCVLAVPNHFEGGEGSRKAVRDGLKTDVAVVCEPTELKVVTGQRGILYLTIRTVGRAAHTTATDIGVNAISRMARVIRALEEMDFRDASGDLVTDPKILNVAMIEGGLEHNLIPESCTLTVDIRFSPRQTQEDVLRDVRAAARAALPDDGFEVEVTPEDTCIRNPRSSLELGEDHPLAVAVAGAHRDATGSAAVFGFHPAWPDTPAFNELGIPTITYGPGSMECYWDDESVELEEYLNAIRTYCVTALRVCAPAT